MEEEFLKETSKPKNKQNKPVDIVQKYIHLDYKETKYIIAKLSETSVKTYDDVAKILNESAILIGEYVVNQLKKELG